MLQLWPKIIILLSAIYHLIAGIFVLGPKSWTIFFSKNTYDLKIPEQYEPRYEICLHFLGLMGIALSFHLFIVFYLGSIEVQKFSLITLALLFITRALFRIIYKKLIFDAYQLSFKRSLFNIIFNILLGIFCFIGTNYL